jgi:putative tryptophan/tyrosine transport system substrate-binding protein
MRRREFVGLLIGWPLVVHAQGMKVPRIGVLNPGPAGVSTSLLDAFYQGMRELGYIEGQNIIIERRYGNWSPDRFHQVASELVGLKVDVIVVISTSPARAAQQATGTIPIVVVGMADPVGDGLVTSLAQPGGNITGTTFLGPELIPKRFGLLKSAIPGLSRVAALWHPGAYGKGTMEGMVKETQASAQELGIELELVEVRGPADFETAFASMIGNHVGAFIALNSPMLYTEYRHIVALAAKSRLPAMYAAREFVDAGGLMSYGASQPDVGKKAATYVDKILKGANPAHLPVEQPTKFELLVNLKTAGELGLTISREFLLIADEVIE